MVKKFAFIVAVKTLQKTDLNNPCSCFVAKIAANGLNKKRVDYHHLWYEYVFGKQTLLQLSERYKISVSGVQRQLKKARSVRIISSEKQAVLLLNTTY